MLGPFPRVTMKAIDCPVYCHGYVTAQPKAVECRMDPSTTKQSTLETRAADKLGVQPLLATVSDVLLASSLLTPTETKASCPEVQEPHSPQRLGTLSLAIPRIPSQDLGLLPLRAPAICFVVLAATCRGVSLPRPVPRQRLWTAAVATRHVQSRRTTVVVCLLPCLQHR
jgi:hypothetical protein